LGPGDGEKALESGKKGFNNSTPPDQGGEGKTIEGYLQGGLKSAKGHGKKHLMAQNESHTRA